jgi:urease accessory protein
MQIRTIWALALLWVLPICASAHSPIKGVMPFYGGMVHPFVVPAHIIAIVSLGLFSGQNATKEAFGPVALTLLITMVAGVSLSGLLGDPDTDIPLLVASTVVALMVSWARPVRLAAVVGAAAVIGLLIGLGSGPEGFVGSKRWIFLAGACLGVLVGTSWIFIMAENAKRPWQKIAVRVVSSWIAASAFVLALTLVGPRKPVPASPAGAVQPAAAGARP